MQLVLSVICAAGFAVLYAATAAFHGGPGVLVGVLVGAVLLAAFLLPTWLFRYSNQDAAPVVLSQLGKRWLVATGLSLLAGGILAVLTPWAGGPQLGEELYMYTLVSVLIFHGLAGLYANHVVYLQATKQYSPNQLLAVTMLLVVLFVLLVLYCLSFDFLTAREVYIYQRDLLLVTLAMVGFGWHAFRIAHH
jgi:hypothetical protein